MSENIPFQRFFFFFFFFCWGGARLCSQSYGEWPAGGGGVGAKMYDYSLDTEEHLSIKKKLN